MNETKIRLMKLSDLKEVSQVHKSAFSNSFITKLGLGAIKRYYKWQLEGPHEHYSLVAERDGRIVGFCVGGISRGSLIGFLRKNIFYLSVVVMLRFWLLFNKELFAKFIYGVRLLLKKIFIDKKEEEKTLGNDSFGILAICVSPGYQGLGISQQLMEVSEKEAIRKNFKQMHLTVAKKNLRAIRFYEKLGYKKIEEKSTKNSVFMEKSVL